MYCRDSGLLEQRHSNTQLTLGGFLGSRLFCCPTGSFPFTFATLGNGRKSEENENGSIIALDNDHVSFRYRNADTRQ